MKTKYRLGQCYIVRLEKREAVVRLDEPNPKGGWIARDLSHGRAVWVRDCSKILGQATPTGLHAVADETIPNRRSKATPPETAERKIASSPPPVVPPGALTLLNAAYFVLRANRKALSTREIVAIIMERNLWQTSGATPWATLNAALNRDIAAHGTKSRFKKKRRGKYALR